MYRSKYGTFKLSGIKTKFKTTAASGRMRTRYITQHPAKHPVFNEGEKVRNEGELRNKWGAIK